VPILLIIPYIEKNTSPPKYGRMSNFSGNFLLFFLDEGNSGAEYDGWNSRTLMIFHCLP